MDLVAFKVMKEKLRAVESRVVEPGSLEAVKRQAQLDILHEVLRTYAVRSGDEQEYSGEHQHQESAEPVRLS